MNQLAFTADPSSQPLKTLLKQDSAPLNTVLEEPTIFDSYKFGNSLAVKYIKDHIFEIFEKAVLVSNDPFSYQSFNILSLWPTVPPEQNIFDFLVDNEIVFKDAQKIFAEKNKLIISRYSVIVVNTLMQRNSLVEKEFPLLHDFLKNSFLRTVLGMFETIFSESEAAFTIQTYLSKNNFIQSVIQFILEETNKFSVVSGFKILTYASKSSLFTNQLTQPKVISSLFKKFDDILILNAQFELISSIFFSKNIVLIESYIESILVSFKSTQLLSEFQICVIQIMTRLIKFSSVARSHLKKSSFIADLLSLINAFSENPFLVEAFSDLMKTVIKYQDLTEFVLPQVLDLLNVSILDNRPNSLRMASWQIFTEMDDLQLTLKFLKPFYSKLNPNILQRMKEIQEMIDFNYGGEVPVQTELNISADLPISSLIQNNQTTFAIRK